ncbi:putative NBD/HSP70 family sugar kinase [Herbihabitans rhizosphaerae]|uniref:Putative NBD/HSP70 family sugar kinase n=1 Tax=Herbihabitans rhizosphaerae TaxID=1872711 RepID=A0A4Q7L5J2_9PSEU|nr:ROK family protein [Herbihabitans rhizosphaerae]RZS43532.1 putative NBD/HSP70 family sugar kinase [Herbihabitans rhizosphaerae]
MRTGSPRRLREINDRAAIAALLREGPLTRADLEYAIGLSKPATAQLLTRLELDGILVKNGVRGGGRGPRAQLWSVNGSVAHVAAVDLRPQTSEFAIADVTGRVLAEHSAPLPVGAGADVVGALRGALIAAASKASLGLDSVRHVMIGVQGALDPATGFLLSAPHLPGWSGFDLPGRLSRALGVAVAVENDVNLVALEEMISGRASELNDFVLVWLDEGVGGAVVVGRRLLKGATGSAGEIDWLRVPAESGGGRFGDLVDSPSIVALAGAHGITATTGPAAVRAAVDQGAGAFLSTLAHRVSLGVANLVSVLDPEVVLLCGEVGRAGGETLARLVTDELHQIVVPRTPVAQAAASGKAVLTGALHSALAAARHEVFGLTQSTAQAPVERHPNPAEELSSTAKN